MIIGLQCPSGPNGGTVFSDTIFMFWNGKINKLMLFIKVYITFLNVVFNFLKNNFLEEQCKNFYCYLFI